MFSMKDTLDNHSACNPLGRHFLSIVILIAFAWCTVPSAAVAAEQSPPPAAATESAAPTQDDFEYLVANRKDPFVPFITEKAATSDAELDEIVEVEGELTGMQLFEPGQLSLVALMKSGDQDYAMVQDFTGKGYVINKGTKIGKRGVVIEIAPNKVVIEETAQTRAGQKIVTNTVMVLKKEGEE
jgi:Tfp pilus assembly protein PilP